MPLTIFPPRPGGAEGVRTLNGSIPRPQHSAARCQCLDPSRALTLMLSQLTRRAARPLPCLAAEAPASPCSQGHPALTAAPVPNTVSRAGEGGVCVWGNDDDAQSGAGTAEVWRWRGGCRGRVPAVITSAIHPGPMRGAQQCARNGIPCVPCHELGCMDERGLWKNLRGLHGAVWL